MCGARPAFVILYGLAARPRSNASYKGGGEMILRLITHSTCDPLRHRFEAGTPEIVPEAIAFHTAMD